MCENLKLALAVYNKAKPYIKNFRTSIDVGCRDGHFSIPMSKDFQKVRSFDYRPGKWNKPQNKPKNLKYFNCALGDVRKLVKAFNGVITKHREGIKGKIITQKTLDSFNFEDVDYIKVDVEGHELKVLKGAENTIKKYYPTITVEENGSAEIWKKGVKDEALNYLKELGYEIVDVVGHDYIMVKND